VIDSGLARFASADPSRGLDRLELGRISRASATQRAGRAGRTAPGRCIRLWTEREQRGLNDVDPPEVARIDLASTVLTLHGWGTSDPSRFEWFEPPPAERLDAAERLLVMLGALGPEDRKLTPLGRRLQAIPAHPRIARLLVAAAESGYSREGAALSALLSERDLLLNERRTTPTGWGSSDLLVRLDLLAEAERQRFSSRLRDRGIDPIAARQIARARDEFVRIARRLHGPREQGDEPDEETMLRWLLLAYPDRVVRRRGAEATGVMVGGRGVRLAPESVVRDAELFLALDPREDRRGPGGAAEARVRIASAVREEWLEALFPDAVRREKRVQFDEPRRRVAAVTEVWYRDLLLNEDRNAAVDPAEASQALAEALGPRAAEFVREDEAASTWLARLEFLHRAMPESGWPEIDDEHLAAVVAEACAGKRTVEEVKRVPLVPLLKARLPYMQARSMDELAPEALTVPSGNRIRLVYEAGRPPVLAVRLQELFGWSDAPRLAGGRVAVLIHLLGPNFRPVQVTEDLRSFWANTYFQVRKDLRARYPRHAWPDDPLTARPESKGGARH
jgi:ATP-dependent helicase HrpB